MSQIDDFLDGNSSAQQTKSQIDSFLDAAPPAQGGAISDLGKSLKVGVQKLPGMVTGLADLPIALTTGARPFTKAADALGEATGFQPGKWAGETKFSHGYEDRKKAVDAAWKDWSAADIAGAYLSNPAYTANQVAEALPSMVAGGVASKALLGAGRVAVDAGKSGNAWFGGAHGGREIGRACGRRRGRGRRDGWSADGRLPGGRPAEERMCAVNPC